MPAVDVYQQYEEWVSHVKAGSTREHATRAMGFVSWSSLRDKFKRAGLPTEVVIEAPAERQTPREARLSLVDERIRRFAGRNKRPSESGTHGTLSLRVPVPGPIGLLIIGDPHVDDDGTDLQLLQRHLRLVRETEGAYSACVGDVTNNWVGKLARLYGEQSTSAQEAWELAEWFFDEAGEKLLWLVAGNHDCWSGAGDPLKWIAKHNHTVYEPWDIVATIHTPDTGSAPFTVNMRHMFRGNSQWNTCHAIAKAAQLGARYDVLTAGHTHQSGYQMVKDAQTGQIIHCIQVASYKIYDRYSREMGLVDRSVSPAAFVVFNPGETGARRATVFHDVEEGIGYLRYKRSAMEG